jgi:hypothetical protein
LSVFKQFVKYFIIVLLFIIAFPYLICPVYKFPEPIVFTGDRIYNPYEGIDSTNWHKANFHAHSRMLFGLMDGRKNLDERILENYKILGYDIIGISDYMYLNSKSFLPVYEHGYGFIKNHFLILGAKNVNWFEILLYKNIHNKQFLINRLKDEDNILAIAHPDMLNAYDPGDFRYLSNYDLIEILRFDRVMTECFDSALSNGYKTFLLGDDDTHNTENPKEAGNCYNMINSESLNQESILKSLKTGKSFAVKTNVIYSDFESKSADFKKIPVFNNISVQGMNISMKFNTRANEIKFIGQNGKVKKILTDTAYADYNFQTEDTYIRTEISFDKFKFFLNPFFRFSGSLENRTAEIDFWKTLIYRLFVITAICILVFFIYKRRKKIIKDKF